MHIDFAPPSKGTYNNAGSCRQLANYLEHEDMERMQQGIYTEGFFNLTEDDIYKSKIIKDIDSNIGQLLKTDAKFFAIHVSPSESELRAMGNTEQEQAKAMKRYIREFFVPEYAKNFNKELSASDIKFYGKIHFNRNRSNNELNMHCHLIVSRKDQTNKKKLSPLTNHKNSKNGIIRGGFDRMNLFQLVEQGFDKLFNYNRQQTESFNYYNTMKNGTIFDQLNLDEQAIISCERKIESIFDCQQKNLFFFNHENKNTNNKVFNTDSNVNSKQNNHTSINSSSCQEGNQTSNSLISFISSGTFFLPSPTNPKEKITKLQKGKKRRRRL